jgi:hypothetical protein
MNFDAVQMEIRPRLMWEASDLGVALGRRHARALVKYWLFLMLPFLAISGCLIFLAPSWSTLLIWWLKPMFGIMPIFVLSRNLFGVQPRASECWRVLGRWLRYRAWWELTLGRFFMRRGMRQVVQVLEGKTTRSRYRLFRSTCPRWLIKGCMALESSLYLSMIASFYWIGSESWKPWREELGGWEGMFHLLQNEFASNLPEVRIFYTVLLLAYALASMIGELLYVCSCFGCYINTRTELEGWDIEIAFKRLSQRLANLAKHSIGTLSCLALIAVLGALFSSSAYAKSDESESKQVAESILEHEDFRIHRSESEELQREENESFGQIAGLGGLVEILGYLILAALIAGIVYLVFVLIRYASRQEIPSITSFSEVKVVAGLSVRPETLPVDVLAVAKNLWACGEQREAMSLLYRAALAWQIFQRGVRIEEADTEGECARKVTAAGAAAHYHSDFFQELTRHWQAMAYAEEFVSTASWLSLCEQWPFFPDTKIKKTADNSAKMNALLLLGFCLLLSSCFERVKVEKTEGYRGVARYQPFLAAERYLNERGWEAESSFSMLGAIQQDSDFNVWLIQPEQLTTTSTARALHQHVSANGGHAIIAVSNLWITEETGWAPRRMVETESAEDVAEALREQLDDEMERQAGGLEDIAETFQQTMEDTKSRKPEKTDAERSAEIFSGPKLMKRLEISSPGVSWMLKELEVNLSEKMNESDTRWKKYDYGKLDWAWPTAFVQSTGKAKPRRILRKRVGAGAITFVPSLRPFTNLRFAQEENALLLESLVTHGNQQSKVCFVRGSGVSFLALLIEHGWRVLAALLFVLLMWIWAVTKGFAPSAAPMLISPSSAFTSLQATGEFLFRHRQWDALLKPWRERLLARWMRMQGDHAPSSQDDVIMAMAEHSGLAAEELRECYSPPSHISPKLFCQLVRRLYRLETKLSPNHHT